MSMDRNETLDKQVVSLCRFQETICREVVTFVHDSPRQDIETGRPIDLVDTDSLRRIFFQADREYLQLSTLLL